jgi:hypothetical protein
MGYFVSVRPAPQSPFAALEVEPDALAFAPSVGDVPANPTVPPRGAAGAGILEAIGNG